jgi:hypothetical protein
MNGICAFLEISESRLVRKAKRCRTSNLSAK